MIKTTSLKKTFLFLFITLTCSLQAQTPTVGLIQHDAGGLDDGYVLFAPIANTTTYLIDKCGRQLHSWTSAYRPGQSVYLLPNGDLLRSANTSNTIFTAGGQGGRVERLSWNGFVNWSYDLADSNYCQHHDIKPMPNGNILVIAWEKKTVAEAIAAGRNPALLGSSLWSEKVIELQPIGNDSAAIVWEWHLWDHLAQEFDAAKLNYNSVSTHPELVNLNFRATTEEDWIHMNSVDYNADLDQIVISAHNFNEIWVIDHSTSTAQAATHTGGNAGHGGDILWRWGNAFAYKQGVVADKKLFMQHSAHWIENGLPHANDIMVFNNGNLRPGGEYSSIDIIKPPVDSNGIYSSVIPYLPDSAYWIYKDSIPTNFYSKNISGAQQLSNGNVLICDGFSGVFFEIDSNKNTVWKYVNPVAVSVYSQGSTNLVQTNVFRCTFYPASYSGFNGQILSSGLPIELNPYPDSCSLTTHAQEINSENILNLYPNPAQNILHVRFPIENKAATIRIFNLCAVQQFSFTTPQNSVDIDVSGLPAGVYFVEVIQGNKLLRKKFVKQ